MKQSSTRPLIPELAALASYTADHAERSLGEYEVYFRTDLLSAGLVDLSCSGLWVRRQSRSNVSLGASMCVNVNW